MSDIENVQCKCTRHARGPDRTNGWHETDWVRGDVHGAGVCAPPSRFFFATLTATVAFGSLFFDFATAAPWPVFNSGFRCASLRAREVDRAPLPRLDTRAGDLLRALPLAGILIELIN